MNSRRLISILLIIAAVGMFCLATVARAQNITAASCNLPDLNTAINAITQASAVITVPACTGNWTSAQISTIPSVNTNLVIQGSTTVNCTGTPGVAGYTCTPNDLTIFQDNDPSAYPSPWVINMSTNSSCPNSCYFRMTGFTMEVGSGVAKDNGDITFNGPNNNFRLDHYHSNGGGDVIFGRMFGQFRGVLDHFLCENGGQCVIFSNNNNDSIGYGDGSWTAATNFGSSDFMFMEDFVSTGGGLLQDCDTGGKFVVRYGNVLNTSSGSAILHTHGTKSPAGRGRGCRAYEAYHLYIQGPSSPAYAFGSSAGGSALVWGNTLASGFQNFFGVEAPRNDGEECETANPNGWGFCGNHVPSGCSTPANSNWDGNSNSTGYPCLDGVGRGQGQALNGQNFPNALNSTTGSISFTHELLEPIYLFDNSLGSAGGMLTLDLSTQNNRDVYYDCSRQNGINGGQVLPVGGTTCNGTFTGAYGTGSGVLSARPSSCTPGPGGTYGASPTGSYGTAYWATDANGGLGELYVCTATNTWTAVYEPYTYPHPLDGGSTTYPLTVSTVGPGTISGCSTGNYAPATPITCNETPTGGAYFTGWSGGTCSGSSPSCSFNLSGPSTVTANFSPTPPSQISLDNHCTQDNGASFLNTVTCGPMTVTAGDGITCELTYSDPYTFSSLVDNVNSGGYLAGIAVHHNTTQGQWYGIYYKPNAQAGSTTITLALSTGSSYSYSGMSCQAWKSSVGGSFIVDSSFSQLQDAAATANPTTGSNKTPAAGNEVVVAAVGMSTQTATAGTNYLIIDPLPGELVFPQYWTQTTATPTNAPYTASSDNWSDLMSAFRFSNGVPSAPTGVSVIVGEP
jgi:hypothetical protein